MGRLISFLSTGVFIGFLAGVFQIPNFMVIMLCVMWLGMGAGMKVWYAAAGALLMPLAMVLPMWFSPAPYGSGKMIPPNDWHIAEFFYVEGAREIKDKSTEAYETSLAKFEADVESGLIPANPKTQPPTPRLHEANIAAAESWTPEKGSYRVWPTTSAFAIGLLATLIVSAINTLTTKPFRPAGPVGAP